MTETLCSVSLILIFAEERSNISSLCVLINFTKTEKNWPHVMINYLGSDSAEYIFQIDKISEV